MDTRRLHFRRLLLLLFALCSFRGAAYAQYEVYANQLISNTADFINPGRAVDADQTNYTYIAAGVGALTSSSLRVRFPEWGNAGDVINIPVQSGSGLLSLSLLDNITIKLYDSAGTTPVATVSGSSLLQLSLLTPGSNIYNLRFITNPSLGFKFKEAQVELNDVLSVSLTQFRVYNVFFQRPCPPVYADKVTAAGASGLLSLASVSNEDRVVDSNPDNYATMNTILSLLGIGQAYIEVGFPRYGKAGDYVGFTVAATSGLLDLSVLSSFTIITYDETGAVKETKAGSSLLTLRLLSGTTNRYSVGFVTAKGSYKISKIRLVKTAVLGLLETVRVYNAFYYTINRPPVTVTTSGPTSFCEGGSVTLTAYDSLGATNYVWSTGATTASITVNTSGTYYVEVTDTFSCVRRSIPIGVIVNPLPRPVITGDSVLCAGNTGSLSLGAVAYASQLWSTGATTASITNVTAGKYYVTVTDVNSCKGADTISVIQNKLNISAAITATTCSNTATGGVSLTVSGGSGTYTYRWSTGATTASVTGLKEGIYTCLIRDNVYNCTYNRSFSVSASNTLSAKVAVVNTSACGQSDGKINLSVIGGSGTYNYLWSNGATTSGITTSAGIYTVTITDATSGCSIKDTVAIGDGGNNLVLTPAITNAASCSSPDGAVALTVTGGSGTYTYTWSTGATTASVTGLKPGNYYVVVKDGACSKALSVVVGSATSLVVNATVVRPGCKKQNGSITIGSVSGGSGSYTYSWSTGATTASVTGLQAGTYLVTVTDAGRGCTKQEVYTLADSSGPTATLAATQPDCGTNSNGAITVTAGGANNVYAWSNGAVTKNLSSLKPGIYTLTVTDTVTGCVAVYQTVLTAKGQMRITASPSSNTSCAEAPDGSVSVTIVGGVSPYTYAWSGGETTKDISGKNAGTYNLTVTDANSCVATISVPVKTDSTKLLKASLASIVKATCNTAANGSAFVTVTGGKAPLTYSWTPGGAATKDLVNVLAGSYTLKVTDGAGCIQQLNVNITIDSAVAMKGTIDSTKAAGCAGSATGAVYVSISGGTAPYTYQWKKGVAIVAAVKNLVGVSAGSYTLTVTDNNGCTLQLNANVPVISTGVTVTLDSVTRPTCNVSADGKVYVTVTGGTSPYTYSWSTGATTEDLTGANPGLLTVTATDALGCPGQLTVNLTYDTSKTLVVKADSARGAGCITGRSGALYITASGGTMPYVYAWTEGSVTPDLINVAPGTYGVTVTDIRGCKANVSGSIGVDTSKSIKAVIDSTEGAGCIGSKSGKIYLTVTRGVAPYTYSWSNGATTKDLTNVAPGLYAVIIADAAGCSQSLSASVGLDLTKKIELTVDSVKGASCLLGANGSVFVTVKGGKAPYLYSWSNGANTASLTNVIPGLYSLTVQDANGCTAELTATVGVDASRAITITGVSIKDAGCIGNASGAISVAVAGGVPPYTYLWSNGATTRDVTGLKPGSYTLTVRDFAGCTAEYSANIKVDVANEIKATASSVVAAKCAGSSSGSVTVSVTGGVSPYTYSWSNGANTKDLSFVQSGSYLLTVTDAIGCTGTLSVNVGIDNSNPVVVKLDSVKAVGCADTLSGAVYVSVSGGTTPYSYMWSTGAVTQDLLNVKVGTYSLNVTDNSGCSDDLSATVGKATQIIVNGDVDMVNCYGGNDGSITVKINGGSGSYRYEWTDGNASGTRTGLVAGSYTVTVTDNASGCTGKDTFAVTQADSLVVSAVVVKDSCLPGFDGRISLLVNGGTKPYTYNWSNGDQTELIQNLAPQNYTVTITDAGGCKATETYAVGAVDCDFTLTIYDVITPNGDGKNDVWVIGGIEFYPNSVLQVVDKWGDIVYEKKGYDNSFTGISSKNNQELPSGTYYYVLKLNGANKTGGKNSFTGSLLIER